MKAYSYITVNYGPSTRNTLDVFQRRLDSKLLKIKWPYIISNIALYNRVEEKPWTETIRTKRLIWLGHIQRLPEETPARITYKERLRPVKRPRGANALTGSTLSTRT